MKVNFWDIILAMKSENAGKKRIYWANSLFTEADRTFNARCAEGIRAAGYTVLLPQEAEINTHVSPTSQDIFRVDSAGILKSDLVVACIDQETIDCGVACEIGLAFAFGIPVIGLYTDIRQLRTGLGHMYKNLYVIGAIEARGEVVSSLDHLIAILPEYFSLGISKVAQRSDQALSQHYDEVAQDYESFVNMLETWYTPRWDYRLYLDELIRALNPRTLLEFGCGTGRLGSYLTAKHQHMSYLGYDTSSGMIHIANTTYRGKRCKFTSNLAEVTDAAVTHPFDLVISCFVLHDQENKTSVLNLLSQFAGKAGHILIIDLSTQDLPLLTQELRAELARPAIAPDPRIDLRWLTEAAASIGLTIIDCRLGVPRIVFPSAKALGRYLTMFGIAQGFDLPLALQANRNLLPRLSPEAVVSNLKYPFMDQRAFVICHFGRTATGSQGSS